MIPVNEPDLGALELEYVNDCLATGWISSAGNYIDAFEREWASYCGRTYGVAMCNGTAALSAAVAALRLSPGDEVILPSFTIISCALAVVENGGVPVLVDCDPDTWTMNVDSLAGKVTGRTAAIMPVHIYGHPAEMDPIQELARARGLAIIEDAAEAHGARCKGRLCGSFGEMSCFSFYANKIITTGEGGMVLTDSPELVERLRSQRNLAFRPEQRFFHTELGHNYRMTNIQAAIGLAQLRKIESHLEKKRWMANAYHERLKAFDQLQLPQERAWAWNVYWMYGVVLRASAGMDARQFADRLRQNGVETRPFFLGMHQQPVFHRMGLFAEESYPVTEHIARYGLYLPSGLTISEDQIDQVCDAIRKALS
ncbi:MAG: DegT/DnrJ/EryC1/StrS family aminotransferase [Anaerolineae bacterium]|jgi:perosamine synthetase|nr:DegT/DnrJ/EryC1/StrS family aminotransferase [Anaerolineae bacterium]